MIEVTAHDLDLILTAFGPWLAGFVLVIVFWVIGALIQLRGK